MMAMSVEAAGTRSRDGQHLVQVHDRLRDAILRGELPPGHATSQAKLASDLGMGRTPLREALRMLQREGLIVSEPNRRVRIAELSSADAEELYVMRIALEAVAVRITVPRLRSVDIAELEGLLAQLDHFAAARDYPGFRRPHRAFHLALVAASGPRVCEMIGRLFDHAERYRLAFGANTPEVYEQRRAEHRALVDAARAGGGGRARGIRILDAGKGRAAGAPPRILDAGDGREVGAHPHPEASALAPVARQARSAPQAATGAADVRR